MRLRSVGIGLLCLLNGVAGVSQSSSLQVSAQDKAVRLNQIQVIGTHNSYNLGFAPSEAKWLQTRNPKAYLALEYKHPPLAQQLDGGVRQLEIDIVSDPKGGRFAHPLIVGLVKQEGLPADPDFDPDHEMEKPGFKVIHVPDLNQRSSCAMFVTCLRTVRAWSKAHADHLPLFLLIESKHGAVKGIPNGVVAEEFTTEVFDALDKEIRSVFAESEMILPDQIRGKYPTLEAAVQAGNWPTLAQSRGKVIFLMDQKDRGPAYTAGHPSLRGRVLFTNATPGDPDAAFIEENSGMKAEIDALVKRGYIIRARTDDSTVAARNNDTTRRDEVLASGAQLISTDYPLAEPSQWSGYSVGFVGGLPGRCNVVNASAGCKDELLELGAKSGGTASPVNHPVSAGSTR